MTDAWRIEVDRRRCVGTGACAYAAPEVFRLDDRSLATVVGKVDGDDAFLRDVVAECPTEALRLSPIDDAR
ncbi:ferredoxin [Pseudofrankia inefficax]|uniref:Ferredoxin n=1 Tax=Pseudofrankia inefficax (strain DSM 45817 / CECT 9037 / DDB 130130 / EuI1c) TaxID=298654 RepID=E3J530_PSEI1|nr:ferredoxin [Pseudofrankia inefficax]ADP79481.1 4Fe-4S ferredoxin iron-sulfur binding domain protein [Pseudofrankia inefficax]